MCGRYTQKLPIALIEDELEIELPFEEKVEARYNIGPTQNCLVLTADHPRQLKAMRWGFVPSWAKEMPKNVLINARADTVATLPSFKHAIQQRRCLVVSDGFYEWKRLGKEKQPMHIFLKKDPLMTFGGIWETWNGPDGVALHTFAIVTTEANALMAEIHDRMPVIVRPGDRELWLDPNSPVTEFEKLMQPLPDGLLDAKEVSTNVNKVSNEGAWVLDPPAPPRPPDQLSLF